ncbi:competence protein CoiA family protein [Streptomyces sp. NPDC079189]|uniref:competence protein CoiA family protein n=1 Tax=unclassified Streptomyces TaxID=2593676 RepID=UPI0033AB24DF
MAFLVWHETWGTVDSTLEDLGCGRSWDSVHHARPRAPLTCRECQHIMVPVRSPRGLHFFRHAPRAPKCSIAGGESIEHHLLKIELAHAARAAGFHAEYEVAAQDRSWRADVMATSADGTRRVALEAQLSPISPESVQARTAQYERDDVAVCWFGVTPRRWVGTAPSLLLNCSDGDRPEWTVSAGIARMSKPDPKSSFHQWLPVEDVNLVDAVAWILNGKMQPHRPLSLAKSVTDENNRQWPPDWVSSTLENWQMWWTTVRHIETDVQQDRDHREQINISKLRAHNPMKAFRARTGIQDIRKLEGLILKQFNNNATRSAADFVMRLSPDYADGLAFYGYRWKGGGVGTVRDLKPLVVVCPDILHGQYWSNDVPVAFPVIYRDRLSRIQHLWLFDLEQGTIWPAEPIESVADSALASWGLAKTIETPPAAERIASANIDHPS